MKLSQLHPGLRIALIVLIVGVAWYQKRKAGDEPGRSERPPVVKRTDSSDSPTRPTPSKPRSSADKPTRPAPAVQSLETIPANQVGRLKSLKGRTVTVTGKLASVNRSKSGQYFLNFEGTAFKAICFKQDAEKFDPRPGAGLEKRLVAISGPISIYNDQPQIKLEDPGQLRAWDPHAVDPAAGKLEQVGSNHWVSPAGLIYRGRDSEGLTRVDHVLRHARDLPSRVGSHGVFDADGDAVFALIDEAWQRAAKTGIRPRDEGHTSSILVPMGRPIGYLGGREGARRNHPKLSKLLIVVRTGTREIITAYPRS